MKRKCETCGREFEPDQPHYRYCSSACRQAAQGPGGPPPHQRAYSGTATRFRLDESYLADGYFVKKGDKNILRDEVVDQWAQEVAKVIGNTDIKAHQLRLFFGKMRALEAKLRGGATFEEIRPAILEFKRDVAYQVGRGVVKEDFKRFIDRNVDIAVQSKENFEEGFIQHFQSVLAYFVYYFRDR